MSWMWVSLILGTLLLVLAFCLGLAAIGSVKDTAERILGPDAQGKVLLEGDELAEALKRREEQRGG